MSVHPEGMQAVGGKAEASHVVFIHPLEGWLSLICPYFLLICPSAALSTPSETLLYLCLLWSSCWPRCLLHGSAVICRMLLSPEASHSRPLTFPPGHKPPDSAGSEEQPQRSRHLLPHVLRWNCVHDWQTLTSYPQPKNKDLKCMLYPAGVFMEKPHPLYTHTSSSGFKFSTHQQTPSTTTSTSPQSSLKPNSSINQTGTTHIKCS